MQERYEEEAMQAALNNAAVNNISTAMRSAYDEFAMMRGGNTAVEFSKNSNGIQIKFPNGHYIIALRDGLPLIETSVGINLRAENFESSQVIHQMAELPRVAESTDY